MLELGWTVSHGGKKINVNKENIKRNLGERSPQKKKKNRNITGRQHQNGAGQHGQQMRLIVYSEAITC